MKISLTVETSYHGCRADVEIDLLEEYDISDTEWLSMDGEEKQAMLHEIACEAIGFNFSYTEGD